MIVKKQNNRTYEALQFLPDNYPIIIYWLVVTETPFTHDPGGITTIEGVNIDENNIILYDHYNEQVKIYSLPTFFSKYEQV